jgi:hypothetical protein
MSGLSERSDADAQIGRQAEAAVPQLVKIHDAARFCPRSAIVDYFHMAIPCDFLWFDLYTRTRFRYRTANKYLGSQSQL